MSTKTDELNDLIEVTRDGKRFYEHARDEVKEPQLKALFTDMAQAKTEVIAALQGKERMQRWFKQFGQHCIAHYVDGHCPHHVSEDGCGFLHGD